MSNLGLEAPSSSKGLARKVIVLLSIFGASAVGHIVYQINHPPKSAEETALEILRSIPQQKPVEVSNAVKTSKNHVMIQSAFSQDLVSDAHYIIEKTKNPSIYSSAKHGLEKLLDKKLNDIMNRKENQGTITGKDINEIRKELRLHADLIINSYNKSGYKKNLI